MHARVVGRDQREEREVFGRRRVLLALRQHVRFFAEVHEELIDDAARDGAFTARLYGFRFLLQVGEALLQVCVNQRARVVALERLFEREEFLNPRLLPALLLIFLLDGLPDGLVVFQLGGALFSRARIAQPFEVAGGAAVAQVSVITVAGFRVRIGAIHILLEERVDERFVATATARLCRLQLQPRNRFVGQRRRQPVVAAREGRKATGQAQLVKGARQV